MVLAFMAFAGTSTYFVLRRLNLSKATEAVAAKDFDAIRTRFGARPPLIEVTGAGVRDFKINRPEQPDGRPVSTLHVLNWTQDDNQVFRTEVPLWLMRGEPARAASAKGEPWPM